MERKTPVLVKWASDNYPPIDFNSRYGDVVQLINAHNDLQSENTQLKEQLSVLKKEVKNLSDAAIIDLAFNPLKEENESLKQSNVLLKEALQEMYDVFESSDRSFALSMGKDILKQYIK